MSTTFTVLGCDGSYAGPGGACTGYLLRTPTTTIWVDAGPGTLGALQRHVRVADLDAVVVSHEHPDHFGELPVFYNACKYYLRVQGLRVITTAGVKRLTDAVTGHDTGDVLAWEVASDGATFDIGDVQLHLSETDHPVETLAPRFDTPAGSVAFTADTGPGWSPEAFGPGLDLLVSEATLPAGYEGEAPHLTAEAAGRKARDAGAARLAITHLMPETDPAPFVDAAADAFGRPVELARPDVTWEV